MLNAGSVYALLGARVDMAGFAKYDAAMKRSIAQAGAAETAIAGSGKRSSAAMMALGTAAKTGAAVGIAAVGAAAIVSIKKAANFQQAMADVQAVTKASAGDMKRLSGAALDLGAKTGVGATKAAGALAELAKGGLSTKQTIGALAGTIAMSQAGGLELADAANTVAQALNLFALKGEDASHVADAFATAANRTTADVSFFAQGLAQGGAAAKAAGLNFDETTAALETLAANGFKSGSDAGTSLKTALTQIAKPTKQAAEEAKKLGLQFFDSSGNFRSLTSISGMLREKLGGLTREQRLQAASTLVGQDGMRALLALYDQGPAKVRAFEQGLRAQGTAQDVANAKMDNLKGSWQRFTAQLQTLAIKVGTAMLPTLQSVTDGVTRFFDSINHGDIRATGFGRFAQSLASAVSPVVGVLRTLASAAASTFGLLAKVPGPQQGMFRAWAAEARGVASSLGAVKDGLDGVANMKPKPVKLQATADVSRALVTLRRLDGTELGKKVVEVATDGDMTVRQRIQGLIALGIPPKRARVIVLGAEAAQGKIASVRDLISTLSDKTITLTTIIRKINQGGSSGFRGTPPKNASGRGPGARGAALVGEGGGPEFYGNPQDGWAMAAGPQIVGLGASDYVIPTEDRYRGRALALMADALGIPGFKKGKKAKKRPKPIHVSPIQYAEYLSPLEAEVTKWQDRVNRDQGLKDDKVQDGKRKGKLTRKAQEARRKLPGERAKLQQAKRELKSAKDYGARIEKQEELANIYADDMGLATTDAAWSSARKKRIAALEAEARLLTSALGLAGGPAATSKWARALRKKLGEAQLDRQDAQGSQMDVSSFTDAQQGRLDELDASLALAELTDTKADDVAALTAKAQFLEPLLGAAQAAGRPTAVTEIAGMLKQTRDSLAEATKPVTPDLSADKQLTTDQAFQRGMAQGRAQFIDRTVDRAFGGPAVVINTLHPGDPATVRAIGDAAAAGFGYQQPRPASTARVGV